MKVVLHHTASEGFRAAFLARRSAGLELAVVDTDDSAGLAREMADADVLLHVLAPIGAEGMDAAPRLRLIQKLGVGVDTIDRVAAHARGIKVANMPGTNSQAVAEMALLLMLGALRRIALFDSQARAGAGWTLRPETFDRLGEVCNRTIGFLGFGEVPRRLAPAIRALGGQVRYHARTVNPEWPDEWCSFDDLIAQSDVLSLHVPLTDETRAVINEASLARTKPGVVIVNTGRGGLIDEAALLAALRSGHVAAAGLDVFAVEPVRPDHPFLSLPNVVVAPHVAWLTPETLARSLDIAFDNCDRLGSGNPLRFEVPPPAAAIDGEK
jgi:phosphoglycerate dehydrogenase-like enzyme